MDTVLGPATTPMAQASLSARQGTTALVDLDIVVMALNTVQTVV